MHSPSTGQSDNTVPLSHPILHKTDVYDGTILTKEETSRPQLHTDRQDILLEHSHYFTP